MSEKSEKVESKDEAVVEDKEVDVESKPEDDAPAIEWRAVDFRMPAQKAPEKPAREDVEWGQIAGLHDAKAALREAIEHPVKYADLYRRYGKRPSRGVLLYGPPGCGKTMLAKAAATALRRAHSALRQVAAAPAAASRSPLYEFMLGGFDPWAGDPATKRKDDPGFIYVKGPEILNAFYGESEKKVRKLFEQARQYRDKHGHPAVMFVDEAEAILAHRSSGRNIATLVPMFLAEMDGFDDSGCFVILATNRPDDLDPAIIREGRIDRKIRISRPDEREAADVFQVHLRSKLAGGVDAEWCARELYAATRVLYRLTYVSKRSADVTLGHLMSGAAIATLVDRALELAIARDIAAGGAEASGLRPEDLRAAVEGLEGEYRALNHYDELVGIVGDAGEHVAMVQKAAKDGTFADVSAAFPGTAKKADSAGAN